MARYLGTEPVKTRPFYFLSYNSEDEARVKGYAMALAGKGVRLWYDEGIEAGSKWEQSIATHINECEAVVMFLSKGIFRKEESFVHKEFELARDYFSKRIIVVLLDQIEKRDVPARYALWWISVTHLQCINAYHFSSVGDCAARIARELGVAAKAEIKTIRYDNGAVYEGQVVNGKPNGRGKKTWTSGDVYEGDWVDGSFNGKGKYIWASGSVYEGDWVDDKRTGKGKYTWANGNVYEGDWVANKRHGKGKFTAANGDVYEGDYVDDKQTGKGKYTWGKGSKWASDVYEGDFVDGKSYGKGKYTWSSGNVYEGDYVDDKRHGKGKYTWSSGNVYEGDWVDDKRHGKGRYTAADGSVYEGKWAAGQYNGYGTIKSASGKILKQGRWKAGKFIG